MGPATRAATLAILLLCLTAGPAAAQGASATFTVNNKGDGNDAIPNNATCATSTGVCTLRAAIQEANSNSDTNRIILPAGTYTLTTGGPGEEAAVTGDLDITRPVTVDGAGARTTIVDGDASDRVFDVRTGAGNVTLEGITVTGGGPPSANGAGILNASTLTVVDSAVRGNEAASSTDGAGIANNGTLTVDRSLITDNQTPSPQGGGGIFNNSSTVTVRNSTISANTATNGSAILDANTGPVTVIEHSTITANTSTDPGSAAVARGIMGGSAQIRDSIVSGNGGAGGNCGGAGFQSLGHNIEQGTSCNFTNAPAGDRNANPLLAALAYSSGSDQTETHAPQPGSPAIDGGNAVGCPATDQRGLPRPSGAGCDVGAFEVQFVPPPPPPPPPPAAPRPAQVLLDPPSANRTPGDANTVTATVRNDDGSPAAGQSVRYAIAGPNDDGGAVSTDASGVARISWEGVHEGTDVLSVFVDSNGNLSSDPGEPTGQASVVWTLPVPRQGRTANIEPLSGRVRITIKGRGSGKVGAAGSSSLLTEARQVPLSTVVDVRRGRVRMTTVSNKSGDVQKGDFYGGVFTTTQSTRSTRPITELRLTESLICRSGSRNREVTASRARRRHLWGNARGRYRTRGRHSTATVRGTIWVQKDSCNSTTTAVRRGVVIVRDIAKRKNVRVKAGQRYVARRASRRRR